MLNQDVTAFRLAPHRVLWQHAPASMQLHVRAAVRAAAAVRVIPQVLIQAVVDSDSTVASHGLTQGDQLLEWLVSERGALPQQRVRAR